MTQKQGTAVVVLMLATLAMDAVPVHPQVTVAPPASTPVVEGLVTEGRVTRVDRQARTIALDNGDEYVIPSPLEAAWTMVTDGSAVRLRYNVDGGRNIVTRLELIP
jgi:hypothetical protein